MKHSYNTANTLGCLGYKALVYKLMKHSLLTYKMAITSLCWIVLAMFWFAPINSPLHGNLFDIGSCDLKWN